MCNRPSQFYHVMLVTIFLTVLSVNLFTVCIIINTTEAIYSIQSLIQEMLVYYKSYSGPDRGGRGLQLAIVLNHLPSEVLKIENKEKDFNGLARSI